MRLLLVFFAQVYDKIAVSRARDKPLIIMKTRVVILTDIIAPYRIPVFNALARREEVDLHVIFLSETDVSIREWRIYSEEIQFSHEILRSWRWHVGKGNLLFNRGLSRALKRFSPGSVICGGYNHLAFWQALRWGKRHHVKFLLWTESNKHDSRTARRWTEALKAYYLRNCDGFVVPGKASSEYLLSIGAPAASIVTAPNAVDNNLYARESGKIRSESSAFREKLNLPTRFILFVGRLVREKGVFELLEAYAELDSSLRSQVGLIFAGNGQSRAALSSRAATISPGTIRFTGFLHREDLPGLYALADALVLPTHSDPWGLVVNEAMACGLPIMVSEVAGCSADLVESGKNGHVVPQGNINALSQAISSVLSDPKLREEMSLHSLSRIKNFSPEICAAGLATAACSAVGAWTS